MKKKLLLLALLFFQIAISQTKFLYGSKTGLREGNSNGEDIKTILNQISGISDFEYYNNILYWINNGGVFYLDNDKVELLTDNIGGNELFIHDDLIYFSRDNEISSYNLTNQVLETIYQLPDSDSFRKIEFNHQNQKIYFQNELSDNLLSIDLNGSNLQVVIPLVHDFAISDTNIYWAPSDGDVSVLLKRSNLFGSQTQDLQSFLYNRDHFREISASTLGNADYIHFTFKSASTNPITLNSFNLNTSSLSTIQTQSQSQGIVNFPKIHSVNGTVYYYTLKSDNNNEIRNGGIVIASGAINFDSNLDFTDSNILVSCEKQIKVYDFEGNFESVLLDRSESLGSIDNFAYNENTNTVFYIQNNIIFRYPLDGNVIYDIYRIPDQVTINDFFIAGANLYWHETDRRSTIVFNIKHNNQSATNDTGVVTDYTSIDVFNYDLFWYDFDFYGIFDGVFKYNFTTNSEEYIEFDPNILYTELSIYDDKIYVLESNSIFEMGLDGSNKNLVLNNSIIISDNGTGNYPGLFTFEGTTDTTPDPPANNNCDTAISLNVGISFEENAIIASNNNSTPSFENSCNAFTTANDIWYSVTIPNTGHIFLETRSNSDIVEDTNIIVYEGSCASLSSIVCNSNSGEGNFSKVIIKDDPGKTLYIRSIDNNNSSGSYQLSAYTSITGPLGDTPDNPIDLVTGEKFEDQQKYISMIAYTPSGISAPQNCGDSTVDRDVWFEARIPDNEEINIETSFINNVSGIIPVISIYTGDSNNLNYVGCTDNQKITLQGDADTIILIRVHDFSNQNITGAFGISAYHKNVLSTNDFSIVANDFKLYPNPVPTNKSTITITTSNAIKGEVSIYNFAGKHIQNQEINGFKEVIEIDIKELSTGIYFVLLKDENGTYFKRFVKN
ncbi:T9SS type A sorting domain-containing protein [Aquimarina sp. 2201CG5-10]|uniref:T9SS type A sorting domain-containing protein n=1 Tax=Aquimarina callyspongiae TaxID=3098150 RepID=UPI002AB3C3FE|nr:T9SS type A sorting domain-containing protein [Aquimarina sp. 2201CG5-10]MDY8137950.1 T9SS type A sorting domain-containing protein [Aquimarina sp. 2201CG5-10]